MSRRHSKLIGRWLRAYWTWNYRATAYESKIPFKSDIASLLSQKWIYLDKNVICIFILNYVYIQRLRVQNSTFTMDLRLILQLLKSEPSKWIIMNAIENAWRHFLKQFLRVLISINCWTHSVITVWHWRKWIDFNARNDRTKTF